jgi:two-component system chemotaxis sensor kinase CheA
MSQLDDFVKEFLTESREGLDRLDSDLISLEENPRDLERCDSAFRSLHTIKGNAGFLDFHRLGELAHAGENVLQLLRGGELQHEPAITDALLELLDALRRMLGQIERSGSEGSDRYEAVEAQLKSFAEPDDEPAAAESPESEIGPPTQEYKPEQNSQPDAFTATVTFTRDTSGASPEKFLDSSSVDANSHAKQQHSSEPQKPIEPPPSDIKPSSSLSGGSSVVSGSSAEHGSSHSGSSTSGFIRVDVQLLDRLMNLVGELVLARNQIVETYGNQTNNSSINPVQRLNLLTSELQEGVLKTRMQQIGTTWNRYPRMVRDLARNCRKDVVLDVQGENTELDKTLLEALTDPLLHLVRNAIDHGIESPDDRRACGKPPQGRLSLRAWHQGGHVHIEVADDGAGLDADRIRDKAVQRGLITAEQAETLQDDELHLLVFAAGFSTSQAITSLSGRGVGLDVVRTNIEGIGGTVDLESVPSQGTTVHITVPLTLAIVPALIVRQCGQRYAIPQVNVIELINLEGLEATQPGELFHNAPVYRLRGELLPLLWLGEVFGREIRPVAPDSEDGLNIVVVQAGARRFALVVDGVSGTEEIVVKPIGSVLDGLKFYTGATIMGDGTVALILDILGLARHAGLLVTRQAVEDQAPSTLTERREDQENLLVCSVGRRQIGLRLADVTRLISVARDGIEIAGHREIMQDGEGLLPLVRTSALLGEQSSPSDSDRLPVVVHNGDHGHIGLIVDRILDIVEHPDDMPEFAPGDQTRAVVVRGKVTDLIDLTSLIGNAGLDADETIARAL